MTGEIPVLYTAGYGNRGFDGFIKLLNRYGVTHLVDVRAVPQSSYWEDFRRENLMDLVPARGLKYVYMGDTLGGVPNSAVLCKEPDTVDIQPLFADPELRKGLDALMKATDRPGRVVCLMCGCMRPHACHRSRLLGRALLDRGIDLRHIDADDEVVRQTNLDLSEQLHLF
ncbi:MAG: DUF488 family protein [Armatimonadetes bacterium]|nr:DUF488 family protein [Armatimonadota bacterium]